MTSPETQLNPIEVTIKNWADGTAKPRLVRRSTFKTYFLDPAAVDKTQRWASICDFEPSRIRLTIQVIDAAVALTLESPVSSPDLAAAIATVAPQGLLLVTGMPPRDFYGPDAMWLNTMALATRVTVVKEYE